MYKLTATLILSLILLSTCKRQYDSVVYFDNVHVLTMENESIVRNQSVLVGDGIILQIAKKGRIKPPKNAVIINDELYMMPGLGEMHAHIPPESQGEERMLDALTLYLSQGITTIRGMLGQPVHLALKERASNGELFSPRIFTSGPSFNANSISSPEQARAMVREQVEAGYDLLKLHPGLTLEQFEAIADEANQLGIEFSGHISLEVGLLNSLSAGKGSIDHLDRYLEFLAGTGPERVDPPIIFFGYDLTDNLDYSLIEEAVRLTKEARVWNVPTNTLLENIFNPNLTTNEMILWPGMEFMPGSTVILWANFVNNLRNSPDYDPHKALRFLELRMQLTHALHQGGAGLLLGADAPQIFNPPGFSIHRELALLVNAGLTPYEALKTGTVNVSVYLGESNKSGKVKEGFRADLMLLSTNPLDSIPFHNEIEGIVINGKWYNKEDIEGRLDEIRNRYTTRINPNTKLLIR